MLNKLRKKIFFAIDKAKGSPIKNNLDILLRYDSLNYDDPWLIEDQRKKIEKLISISVVNTEYYQKYKGLSFDSFPLIDKNIIKQNQKQIMNKRYDINSLFQMSTSGSTGTPFVCY